LLSDITWQFLAHTYEIRFASSSVVKVARYGDNERIICFHPTASVYGVVQAFNRALSGGGRSQKQKKREKRRNEQVERYLNGKEIKSRKDIVEHKWEVLTDHDPDW